MVPSPTITHNPDDLARFLDYNEGVEHPVVLQVCCGTYWYTIRVTHTGMYYCCAIG